MPRRDDIKKILVIGSGPIVVGQACEFDYSGAQACKVLREEGYEVVLINSNPATIMTDPEMAARTYVEPITPEFIERVIKAERPDALLATLGAQTGLNNAIACEDQGILKEYGVELIGVDTAAIRRGEDRKLFAEAMERIGLDMPKARYAYSVEDALSFQEEIGFPIVCRPSFTMGGAGGGIAYNKEELVDIVGLGLSLSPATEVLLEESIIGWKELEIEAMRDAKDNCVIVCSIENFDAMGVHTGDSITVAPAQTLSTPEYEQMCEASIAVLREIGVRSGGANIQFAINPKDGRLIVIEMNPRVSRSSALASKATGVPIAKISAMLAVGYTLDELPNDMTKLPSAAEGPTIDYTVVKVPRWAFEKFKGTDEGLTTRMKSVGEVMAIGATFAESLGKAMRALENGRGGLGADGKDVFIEHKFDEMLSLPNEQRIFYIAEALRRGYSIEQLFELTHVDPWFLGRLAEAIAIETVIKGRDLASLSLDELREAKRQGLSDAQIAHLCDATEPEVRAVRKAREIVPVFRKVDSCSGTHPVGARYFYKTYEAHTEFTPAERERIVILGAGPNRIGQGIEFDYCCVHAAYALRDMGYEVVMVNCNPETVSTDYDTSDRLYFEPLTFEDVMDVLDVEQPIGVVVTFGGQTPLKLANALEEAGVPILGTQPEAIDLAEDRKRFSAVLDELEIPYPAAGTAFSVEEAKTVAREIGFPLLVRPSYVLGGRGMVIAYDETYLEKYMIEAAKITPDYPVLLDRFLEGAIEVDADAVCDGEDVYIGGIMEHIEEAGIHSGDSACCIPAFSLSHTVLETIAEYTRKLALRLGVRGLMNVQYAVKDEVVYVIEVNPRASRTVPFVSKATGVQLAKIAAQVMAGRKLADLDLPSDTQMPTRYCVKEAVLPFGRFPGADTVLGPEMKSTGEVMGSAADFPTAFAKSQLAIDYSLPTSGTAFISVADKEKRAIVPLVKQLHDMGFAITATKGTARVLGAAGIPCEVMLKKREGRPNVIDAITDGEISLVINTPFGSEARSDGYHIRSAAVRECITNVTTIPAASAVVAAIEAVRDGRLDVCALQDF
ncbi:MAG: carbamoyl-phosphate synthase large subunit [Coriobacteriia bacterium]|nr:carbamoyl-phosphate synthase large subunit [Coriobacteriia bacterium]